MIYRKHFVFTLLLLIAVVVFGFFSIKEMWYLLNYHVHKGNKPGVFGWPIPFQHSLFYALYWAAGLVGAILLLLLRKEGWVLTQIIVFSGTAILFLAVVMSVFTPLEYIDLPHTLVLMVGCLLLWVLNSTSLLHSISIKKDYDSYRPILMGILVLAVLAVFIFDVFSLSE